MRRDHVLPKDERGVALVMVIWVLALLSLMAASFLAEARVELRRAGNLRERAQAEALAEAGIQVAVARIMAEHGATRPQRWTEPMAGGSVAITLSDERGKIDLNEAEPTLLASLFESQGVPARGAKALAAAVADFRDPDRAQAIDGAEDADYPPGSGGAKDARFESVDELLQVKGMTPALYGRIAPLITIHSGLPTIDPLLAEPAVLKAVPNIDGAELDRFLALRKKLAPVLSAPVATDQADRPAIGQRRAKASADLQAAIPRRNAVERYYTSELGTAPAFTISAEAVTREGARFRREALMRLLEDRTEPFELLEWRRPRFAEPDSY
jgi:general secretion pathway protein K